MSAGYMQGMQLSEDVSALLAHLKASTLLCHCSHACQAWQLV